MTEFAEIGISNNRISVLKKNGFFCVEDIQEFFPRKYYDFTSPAQLTPSNHEKYVAIVGILTNVSTDKTRKTLMLKAKVYDEATGNKLNVLWIGSYYLKNIISEWKKERVVVCGKMTYMEEYHSYHMLNPLIFEKEIEYGLRIVPIYKKISGISEDFMLKTIHESLSVIRKDLIPEYLRQKYRLMNIDRAIKAVHEPNSMEELTQAKKRIVYEKLFLFAAQIEKKERAVSKGTIYNIKSLKNRTNYVLSLPFTLTKSQVHVLEDMTNAAYNGLRIHALIQGDVGSGKTILAFLIMLAMADSGYQSILLAPTQLLAKQHYDKLIKSTEKYGYKTAFLSSETKKSDKKKILTGIKDGDYSFIVGTHSILNPSIEYQNLALIVIDEEHRFGVDQRSLLTNRAKMGVHCINMSGTPIPRTLASALYGPSIKVYDLEPPAFRKPVLTTIFNNETKICEFIHKKIVLGQQAYIVCPWIEDEDEKGTVETVESAFRFYQNYFQGYPEITIGCVTGKMPANESNKVISDFTSGSLKILISTTVIEVGIDVPNANVIVINNADRFGLAQLHQLRGRVGRGSSQGYCILKSEDRENKRLEVMCRCTNGLEIAEEDMKIRGSGNLLGTEQSGKNEFYDLIMQYPNMYKKAKEDAMKAVEICSV